MEAKEKVDRSDRFTNAMIPLLREYRDRVEGFCLLWSRRTRKELFTSYHLSWQSFSSYVSQSIEHTAIRDERRIELILRLREFESAVERLKNSIEP